MSQPSGTQYTINEVERVGLPGRILTDSRHGIEVLILDRGAEPVSIRRRTKDGQWKSHIARESQIDPESAWNPLHSTHLGPYAHTLLDNISPYGDAFVRGAGHGLLPDFQYKRIKAIVGGSGDNEAGAVVEYRIEPGDYPTERYPRALAVTIRQALVDGRFEVRYTVENREHGRPIHVSFGAHPALPIAQPEQVEITLAPGLYRHHLIDQAVKLTGEKRDFTVGEDFLFPWSVESLSTPVMLEMLEVERPMVTVFDPVVGVGAEFDLTERPYPTFWSNHASFVCFEPIWGLPDPSWRVPFDQKPGIIEIAPGETISRGFTVRFFGNE